MEKNRTTEILWMDGKNCIIGMDKRHRKKKSKDDGHESHRRQKNRAGRRSWGTIVLSREQTELNDFLKKQKNTPSSRAGRRS